jgi:hypothetical protein
MRLVIALALIIYLVGAGVALAPTVESKWRTAPASDFAASVARNLPRAAAWPARAYRRLAERG